MHARAERLGDTGISAPSQWTPRLSDDFVAALVIVTAESRERRAERVAELRVIAGEAGVVEVADLLEADALTGQREHFGYRDGIAQPSIEGGLIDQPGMGAPQPGGGWRPIKPGEFVIGYEAERRAPPLPEGVGDLCLNGTYVVFRKLRQDVALFRAFLAHAATTAYGSDGPAGQERIAAKLVGRWRSGAPVSLYPDRDGGSPENDFRYQVSEDVIPAA
jgi:deferrochelatase/peroxidase EfeB